MGDVVPYTLALQDEVIELILTIQQVEFGFKISAEDQPDLLDVENSYQTGAGGFWVALVEEKRSVLSHCATSARGRAPCGRCS